MQVLKPVKIITGAFISTSVMTLFSEIVAQIKGENYNEAEILAKLIHRISSLNKTRSLAGGWAAHYLVGVFFAAIYDLYLKLSKTDPGILNGAVFGGVAGLTGAGVWDLTLHAHPFPPGFNRKQYYQQLVIAHIIFGIILAVVFKKAGNKKSGEAAPQFN